MTEKKDSQVKKVRLVIISGPSGAGKSTAIKVLEDLNFFCVDNLPLVLLPKFMELSIQSAEINKVAIVVDVREREFLKEFASDDILLRRFSETRRRHPLAEGEGSLEGIRREREMLAKVKIAAGKIIDTSGYNVHQLKEIIRDYFSGPAQQEKMVVQLVSFSYRYGIPSDADMIMDVRFLPNPYFIEELKDLDGRDSRVKEFVLNKQETKDFFVKFDSLLDFLIPNYWKEGKTYLTIAVGCTGGKHRSVAIVDVLADKISWDKCVIKKRHRDIDRQ
ncbi:MAG: RNase adaptor protein RapZ [Deltaproteobacteria bacterium]|nr:RNase adaptor protein RapZ [Deltaproteobacteria bacterium]